MPQPVKNPNSSAPPPADLAPASAAPSEHASFGKVAIRLGFITQAQLEEAVRVQQATAKVGLRKRLGEILIKKGYLSSDQVHKIQQAQTMRKRIGDYELVSKLGEGGMGAVFKARQVSMDRIVALKLLSAKVAKNPDFRERFVREARSVAKLNHPHIVTGIDVGSADGYCYFTMEFVDGETLGEYMHNRGGKLPEREGLELIRQIALALQHAHENGLLHRDIKPDNILLERKHKIAKLVDLGLARSTENSDEDAALTQAGQCVGTPFYIAPEQARGLADLTPAADLYGLGATMFHVLTGQVPYDGSTAAVIMTRHLADPVPSARQVNPALSADVDRIIKRLMQKDLDDRYESGNDLVADIDRVLNGEEVPATPAQGKRKVKGSTKAPRENAVPASRPKAVVPVRGRVGDEDDDSEDSPGTPSGMHPRAVRRKRRVRGMVGGNLGMLAVAGVALIIGVVVLKSSGILDGAPPPVPTPPPSRTPVVQAPPAEPAPPPVTPVTLAQSDAGLSYQTDFSSGIPEHCDVDPQFGMAGRYVKIVDDPSLNKRVLKLAPVRHRDSYCMARLLLPADLHVSRGAVVAFSIHCASGDPDLEIRVGWDHILDKMPRTLSRWKIDGSAARSGWQKFELALDTAKERVPSKEVAGDPQFVAIFAGKPGRPVDVYLESIEIKDPGPDAAVAPTKPRAAENTDDKETPVAPSPKKPAPGKEPTPDQSDQPAKEPPVAPPPKKAPADAINGAL